MSAELLPKPLLAVTALDCPNARELATFYGELLGWSVDEEDSDDEWVTLTPPGGVLDRDHPTGQATLAFQTIADWSPPSGPGGDRPQQVHLDFWVPDVAAAEPGVLALGATRAEHQPGEQMGSTFRVYLDPVGHPFCLVQG